MDLDILASLFLHFCFFLVFEYFLVYQLFFCLLFLLFKLLDLFLKSCYLIYT